MEIEVEGSKLFYTKTGDGPKVMFLLHGAGQDHTAFNTLLPLLLNDYTCFTIDLFFHGKSFWKNPEQPVSKEVVLSFLKRIIQKHNISRFSIVSYSIGSRFALVFTEEFCSNIERLIFIAPDGIVKNFWYTFATSSALMRALFKKIATHPTLFNDIVRLLERMHLIPRTLAVFARHQMNSLEKRQSVFHTWTCFRKLTINKSSLSLQLHRHQVRCLFVLGEGDLLIKTNRVKAFASNLPKAQVIVLPEPHHKVLNHCAPVLSEWLASARD